MSDSKSTLDAVCDLDDCTHEEQLAPLVSLHSQVPHLQCTVYAIPNRLGQIHSWRSKYPWISFGIHGWEHTHFECLTWTEEDAHRYISKSLEMGYDPLFKGPNWIVDIEVERACQKLDVLLHSHPSYTPITKDLRWYATSLLPAKGVKPLHTHLLQNPVTDWIGTHPGFFPETLAKINTFWPIAAFCETVGATSSEQPNEPRPPRNLSRHLE